MSEWFFPVVLVVAFLLLLIVGYAYTILRKVDRTDYMEVYTEVRTYRNILIYSFCILLSIFFGVKWALHEGLEAHLLDWMNLVIRWAHVVLGIAWIGASFYFIFLENSLNRKENLRDEIAGNLWAIHGGGFYYVEKYKNAPSAIPEKLHWFKYEAYFTWLTGVILLMLVYYFNAGAMMTDPSVSNISNVNSIILGAGSLIAGWFIYDILCRSSLFKKPRLFGLIGLLILVVISFILSKYLSGRAAFMHVGALLGTIMAGNVFFVIIPSQKALVKAAAQNQIPDPELGKNAGLRSLHNNYITLPVIFIMISNHFPSTFGPSFNWIILTLLTITSVVVRHYINLYEKGRQALYLILFAFAGLISLIIITAPSTRNIKYSKPVSFAEVQPVFQKRCNSCHSSAPTDDIQKVAPNGLMFDTEEQILKVKDRIFFRAVQTKTMPQGNKTGITDEERQMIGSWVMREK
jgi:uncharacterized membrane protein